MLSHVSKAFVDCRLGRFSLKCIHRCIGPLDVSRVYKKLHFCCQNCLLTYFLVNLVCIAHCKVFSPSIIPKVRSNSAFSLHSLQRRFIEKTRQEGRRYFTCCIDASPFLTLTFVCLSLLKMPMCTPNGYFFVHLYQQLLTSIRGQ